MPTLGNVPARRVILLAIGKHMVLRALDKNQEDGPLYQQHGGSSPRAPGLMTQVKCVFEVLLMHGQGVWEGEEVPHDKDR